MSNNVDSKSHSNSTFRYPADIKRKAVQRVSDGESMLSVAKDIKIAPLTMSRWVKEFKIDVKPEPKVDKTELEELRKQVKQLNAYVHKLERLLISDMIKNTPTLSVLDRVDAMFGE